MQQVLASAWPARSDCGIYVVWIGVVWAAVLLGFGLDFSRYLPETPPPPLLLHIHGAVYVLWLGLVTLQILWVEAGNLRRHKQFGWLIVGLSALMVPLGLAAALADQVRQIPHLDYAPEFLALEFEEMVAFSVFMGAGVILRRDPPAHKRLMILSAVAISDAGFARIWMTVIKVQVPGAFGFWLEYFSGIALLLIAMAVWDLWRRRRVHPTVLAGAALLWTGEIIAAELNFSPTWHAAMIRLVSAWGYGG